MFKNVRPRGYRDASRALETKVTFLLVQESNLGPAAHSLTTLAVETLTRFRLRLISPMAAVKPRGNVPQEPLRWTIERASGEFQVAPVSLRKYLRQSGAEPDEGGCYSTRQITESLFGDLKAERLRKERQLTKRYSLENAVTEGSYLNRNELSRALAAVADAVVSKIMSSPLPRNVKEDVLRDIAELPLKLQEVGDRQSRLRRAANGNGSED